MTAPVETINSKPVGVVLIGLVLLGFGAISALIGVALAAGNALLFDTGPQPIWMLLVASLVALVVADVAVRIGLGLLREPASNRKAGEVAVWAGVRSLGSPSWPSI